MLNWKMDCTISKMTKLNAVQMIDCGKKCVSFHTTSCLFYVDVGKLERIATIYLPR